MASSIAMSYATKHIFGPTAAQVLRSRNIDSVIQKLACPQRRRGTRSSMRRLPMVNPLLILELEGNNNKRIYTA